MKNTLLILLVALLAGGCSPKIPLPKERIVDTYVFDLRKYTQEGFFICSTPYAGTFDPVAELTIQVVPAVNYEKTKYIGDPYIKITEIITADELLKTIVGEAKKLGADALVNLSIKPVYEPGTKDVNHYELSGFAIKRK